MRNGFLFFLGLFAALTFSFAGIVLWSNHQLGALAPFYVEDDAKAYPERTPGLATQGQLVYADLGCAACHTQQVRRASFGSDKARGWGERQSVARDYVQQTHVYLGESRIGPDLANVGARKPAYDEADLYKLLYAGAAGMPSYRFLFEQKSVAGRQTSDAALSFGGRLSAPAGSEIVPTPRARALVAYLLSLNQSYEYPEARAVEPAATEGEAK
jgi:cytochrome c oxidase cbb3-type subunit II